MAIQGLRDTSNFVANQAPENWREAILRLMPNSAQAAKAPLTALTSKMKTESTTSRIFHWWEKSTETRRLTLTANLAAASSGQVQSITVSAGGLAFKDGDLFLVENGLGSGAACEILQVTGDPTSDTQLNVARGASGSTAATLNVSGAGINPNIVCIGNSYEEGSLAPTGVHFDPVEKYNYTQIFRQTYELTRSAMKEKLRTTPNAEAEAKRDCLEVLGIDMERAWLFGKRHATTKNSKPIRYTNGIYHQLASGNKLAATSNALKMEQLESWMLSFFAYGSSQKVALGGNRALLAIQQAVRKNSSYQIFTNEKEYGIRVVKIISPFGELVFMAHPLFNQMSGGTTSATAYYGLEASMFVLDMANFKYRPLEGSDIHFEDELEAPGQDGIKSGFIGECGLEVNHLSTHFFCYNMNAGAADA